MPQERKFDLPSVVVVASSLILLFLNLITPISNHDIGFDIATGRFIRESFSIPDVDVFSHTFQGSPWIIYQWLPDIVFSLIYDITGPDGLVLFKTLIIFLSILVVFFRALKIYGAIAASAGLCLSSLLLSHASDVRTYIFGYPFMAFIILLLNNGRFNIEKSKVKFVFLAATFFLWANVHVSVFLGCIYVAVYGVVDNSTNNNRIKKLTYTALATFLGVGAGITVAAMISPHGFDLWKRLFSLVVDPYFSRVYAELKPFFSLNGYQPLFIIGMVFSSIMAITSGKKNHFNIGVFIVFSLLTIKSARNAGMLAFVMVLPIACGIYVFAGFFSFRKKSVELFLALIAFIIAVFAGLDEPRGLGFAKGFYPKRVYSFIRNSEIPGKAFNDMWYGGSFILEFYPERKVFIDSRTALIYPVDFLKWDYSIIKFAKPGWEGMLLKYDVNWLLLINGRYERLRKALFKSPNWAPLYKDGISDIFLKKTEANLLFSEKLIKSSKTNLYE